MPDNAPRWLDASAAAAYLTMTQAAFLRRVASGTFPKPNHAGGIKTPRWDRLALDATFEAGIDSTDARTVFQGIADDIAAKGSARRTHRAAYSGGRDGQRVPLRATEAEDSHPRGGG